MLFVTEAELREQWRTNGAARFEFPVGTRFSPSGLDFINQWKLQVFVGGEPLTSSSPRVSHYSEDGLPYLGKK